MAGASLTPEVHPRRNFWTHLRPYRVYASAIRFSHTLCLGGLSFLAFLILVVTGVLLLFQYLPGVDRAFAAVTAIDSVFPFGRLFRALHFWAGQIMVLTVFLHMGRVFYTGSYRPPREMNWIIGVGLLVLTVVLDFTGYLLRGDQEALAAATVGANLMREIPGVGSALASIFFGDVSGGGATLQVYIWHIVGLPMIIGILIGLHFWRVRKDGISRPL